MLTLNRIVLCPLDDLPVGLGRAFEVEGKPIAVFRTRGGRVFATDGFCPHKNGPLADGMLTGDSVVCPYHNFRFDATTGECDQPGICSIATYPVEVTDSGIVVTL